MAIGIEGRNDYPYRDRGGTTMAIAIGGRNEYGYSDSDVVDTGVLLQRLEDVIVL